MTTTAHKQFSHLAYLKTPYQVLWYGINNGIIPGPEVMRDEFVEYFGKYLNLLKRFRDRFPEHWQNNEAYEELVNKISTSHEEMFSTIVLNTPKATHTIFSQLRGNQDNAEFVSRFLQEEEEQFVERIMVYPGQLLLVTVQGPGQSFEFEEHEYSTHVVDTPWKLAGLNFNYLGSGFLKIIYSTIIA